MKPRPSPLENGIRFSRGNPGRSRSASIHIVTAVRWIEAFDMVQNEAGEWLWDPFIDRHERLHDDYLALQREWNRFVPEYNAMVQPRNIGRPLAASEAQVAQVRKLRKAGRSLRSIAEEMSLSVRTVRTIVEQKDGRDRRERCP